MKVTAMNRQMPLRQVIANMRHTHSLKEFRAIFASAGTRNDHADATVGAVRYQGSVVCLDTWVMGDWMWGNADEADSIKTIHAALDAGINLIGTAPIYGFGLSEEVVGKALKDRRDKAVIATKCSLVANPTACKRQFRSNAPGPGHELQRINEAICVYHEHPTSTA